MEMSKKKNGSNFGGYVGIYNGNILKSSYEYMFAKILENDGIKYRVEEKIFNLDNLGVRYTPDFFLYDESDKLYEIVEIRGHRFDIEERIESTNSLREIVDKSIEVNLYTEVDIREMCKDRGMSYNTLKTSWRTSPDTIRGSSKGRANSMYGIPMTDKTKSLISQRGKERVLKDPEKYKKLGQNLAQWGRDRGFYFTKKERSKRIALICTNCGSEFIVTEAESHKRKYCSMKCGSVVNASYATEVAMQKRVDRDLSLSNFIIDWAYGNSDLVFASKYNDITPTLKPLLELIEQKFNIKDFRTISQSMGTKSRKEFLRILKGYVSNK